jgi:hypothetical protein
MIRFKVESRGKNVLDVNADVEGDRWNCHWVPSDHQQEGGFVSFSTNNFSTKEDMTQKVAFFFDNLDVAKKVLIALATAVSQGEKAAKAKKEAA